MSLVCLLHLKYSFVYIPKCLNNVQFTSIGNKHR